MVGMTRFEHATLWSQTRCSTKLSHIPIENSRLFIALHLLQLLHPGSSVNWLRSTYYLDKIEYLSATSALAAEAVAVSVVLVRAKSQRGRPRIDIFVFTATLLLPAAVTEFICRNLLPCDQYGLC